MKLKQTLVAASMAALMSVPALAQQVQVYGVIDQTVRNTSPKSGPSVTTMESGTWGASRLGFKGSEDLGGGLSVSFKLEGAIDTSDGYMGKETGGQNNLFSRESSISLTSKQLGSLTMGRSDTSYAESLDIFASVGFGKLAWTSGMEYSTDRASTVKYTSPKISDMEFQLGHSMGTTSEVETTSASLTWTKGPAGFGIGRDEQVGGKSYTAIAARYDFGVANVGLLLAKRNTPTTDTDVAILTANVPLGNGFSALGSYQGIDASNAAKINMYTVGIKKDLSKRTFLLAAFRDTDRGTDAGQFTQLGIVHTF